MSDRTIRILLIDQDSIFRLGLRVVLEAEANFEVVGEAQTDVEALEIVTRLTLENQNQLDLVILDIDNGYSNRTQPDSLQTTLQANLQLCQQLKAQYPQLPILILSATQNQQLIATAQQLGANGYYSKGIPVSELVTAINAVTSGYPLTFPPPLLPSAPSPSFPLSRYLQQIKLSGNRYIQENLVQVTGKLQIPGLPVLDKAILAGKQRELIAARWLLNKILVVNIPTSQTETRADIPNIPPIPNVIEPGNQENIFTSINGQVDTSATPNLPSQLSPRRLQSDLFSACVSQLQLPLQNVTDVNLEIDIFRVEKKRELLYLILQKLAEVLDDLRSSKIEVNQLYEMNNLILRDLWQTVIIDFFGKFSRVKIGDKDVETANLLLADAEIIQREILDYIPLFPELLSYLIFQTEFYIDNNVYLAGSLEAKSHALRILENLLIQVANSVIQPLLNKIADIEEIKQKFYDRQYISTREIEKFRNNLSWKYRLRNYVTEPQAIFESRYELFVFAPRGIAKISIYAPRRVELSQLKGIPLVITLLLEFRDAVTPRLRSILSLLGSGVVFILTQVIGRGLGLIGRGILQGIGSISFLEGKSKK
ncbi:response regulator receiver protein [Calothrix sp. NIES-4101]|nr:response regulator receiver protein [Calothrix sp. NIES-4101]